MIRLVFGLALLFSANYANAAVVSANSYKIFGSFSAAILSGHYSVWRIDGAPDNSPPLPSHIISVGLYAELVQDFRNEYELPPFYIGDLGASIPDIPNTSVGGDVSEPDEIGGVLVSETFNSFRVEIDARDAEYGGNNWANITLVASRSGNRLYNWRGILSGYAYLQGYDGIYDYYLSDVSFLIDEGEITVLGLSPVPEPSAWATLTAGFWMTGLAVRRRQKQQGGQLRYNT